MKKYKKESRINNYTAPLLRCVMMCAQLLLALLLCPPIRAQATQQWDVWEPLKYFVGSWEGAAKGRPGNGKVEREYQFVLNGKYPAGWRARESYRILNDDEFVEVFELAVPGKEFEVYAENRFKRKK